jgi:hypothetical protein
MESPVLKLKKQKGPNLYLLTRAKTIQEEDIEVHAKWAIVKKWYDDTKNHPDVEWVDKAMTTILNSIVYQNRAVFAVTLEKTRELLRGDKNWWVDGEKGSGIGLKDTNYSLLFNKLVEAGVIEQVREQKHREPRVFRVCEGDFKDMLEINISAEEQEREVLDFIDNSKGSAEGSTEGSTKGNTEIKKERKIEKKEQNFIINNKPEENTKSKATLEDLLGALFNPTGDYPRYEELREVAIYVIEHIPTFKAENHDMYVFKEYFKNLKNLKKPSQHIINLAERFKQEVDKIAANEKLENIEVKDFNTVINQHKTSVSKKAKESLDVTQQNTINAIVGFENEQTITAIKNKLETEEDPRIRRSLESQLHYWQKVANS